VYALDSQINTPYLLEEKASKPHGSMAYPQGISPLPDKLGDETIRVWVNAGEWFTDGRNPYKTFSHSNIPSWSRYAYLNSGYHSVA